MAAMRTTPRGDRIDVDLLHDFIRCALAHDAVADPVFETLYEHVVAGRLHASVIAASLKPSIEEVLEAASDEDWQTVADELIDDTRKVLGC